MTQSRIHLILVWAWAVQGVGALACLFLAMTHHVDPTSYFLLSVGYISLCSIYANFCTHWGAYEAARAKEAVELTGKTEP